VVDLTVFSTLIYFGYRPRFNPAAHKRLMLMATVALLDAAFSRWPILVVGNGLVADFCCYALLALLAVYAIWSIEKAYRATLWSSTLLIVAHHPILSILDRTVAWHRFAMYLQRFGVCTQYGFGRGPNMVLISRRQFVKQRALTAAALYGRPSPL
jgi:hypothetical protein